MERLFEDGAVLTEDGIEYLRASYLGRAKARFSEIESVEVVPFYFTVFPIYFRCGLSVYSLRTRLFSDSVLVKFNKPPKKFELHIEYLLFTPKDPVDFVERLRRRLTMDSPDAS